MNVGLVLSGGMAKGAYELGALRAVSEYFHPEDIKYISSASVGVLNSYAFASGNLPSATDLWTGMCPERDSVFISSVFKNNYLKESISVLSKRPVSCQRLYIPLFHLKKRQNFYIDISGKDPADVEDYLNAAVAVFPICKPVLIGNKYFYDGAVIDNIPVYPLLKHDLDYIICIYFDEFDYTFESSHFDGKVIKITFGDCNRLLKKSLWLSQEETEAMIHAGYKRAKSVLDFVFSSGIENVEAVHTQIETLNSLRPNSQLRLTSDVVVKGLNKVAQRLTKRNVIQ
ncbi:MAG: hypothetical protein E7450_01435 [Ruminococcaceae bacterium]|nr:hypothetical protein [Oscillospiraceae bacterium]